MRCQHAIMLTDKRPRSSFDKSTCLSVCTTSTRSRGFHHLVDRLVSRGYSSTTPLSLRQDDASVCFARSADVNCFVRPNGSYGARTVRARFEAFRGAAPRTMYDFAPCAGMWPSLPSAEPATYGTFARNPYALAVMALALHIVVVAVPLPRS